MFPKRVFLSVQPQVQNCGRDQCDDNSDPDMVPLINRLTIAKSLLAHLIWGISVNAVAVDIKNAITLVLAAVDVVTNKTADRPCGLTSATTDGSIVDIAERVVGRRVAVLPWASTSRLQRAVRGRTEVRRGGEIELRVEGKGCAFGGRTALFTCRWK